MTTEKAWKPGTPLMKLSAFVTLLAVVFPDLSIYFYVAPVAVVALFSTVYSYWLYHEE